MNNRPSEDIFEGYKQREILAPNQNPGLQNRPISFVRFESDQPIKCSDSEFFKYLESILRGPVIHIYSGVRVVKGIIPDRIFYPHPHFLPIFCLNLRKKVMENPRKSHPFYNPEWGIDWLISPRF
jgi:hypothetical protein